MGYNLIMFKHKEGDPEHEDALKAGVFPHERGDPKIEIAWTVAPLILVIWLTYISLAPLDYLWDVPDVQVKKSELLDVMRSWLLSSNVKTKNWAEEYR